MSKQNPASFAKRQREQEQKRHADMKRRKMADRRQVKRDGGDPLAEDVDALTPPTMGAPLVPAATTAPAPTPVAAPHPKPAPEIIPPISGR